MKRPLGLRFDRNASDVVRRRITYAFESFCAVYGYDAALDDAADCPRICYGVPASAPGEVAIAARYDGRPCTVPAPAPSEVQLPLRQAHVRAGVQTMPCFYASADGSDVDWLGEIFEWLSCADEFAVVERDSVGRIPFAASLHGRFQIDPTIPYAALAMCELNARIPQAYEAPQKPWDDEHDVVIAATHDLDYLPLGAVDKVKRLLKNAAYAIKGDRDLALFGEIVKAGARGVATWRFPLDCIDTMREREREQGIASTWNVICSQAHKRDANYRLADPRVRSTIDALAGDGMEIAVHGSYTSLNGDGLEREVLALAQLGYPASGVRQHWLRYARDNLFEAVERLGLAYDSTAGFCDRVGFRAGACFPYEPYDFREERAYRFVEIPLVIMDGALYQHAKAANADPEDLCERVLARTGAYGWGGVSILWHNTVFAGAHLPPRYGELYWSLKRPTQRWTTAKQVAAVATAHQKAGSPAGARA